MSRCRIALAFALSFATGLAVAQDDDAEPGGTSPDGAPDARVQALRVDEVVAITGSFLQTSSCETFVGIHPGMPEGAMPIAGALAATLRVDHSGQDVCAVVATERPYSLVLPGGSGENVALYVELRVRGGPRRVELQIVPVQDP